METTQQIGLPEINSNSGYDSNKTYTLYVNPVNRHIAGMIGFIGGVDYVNDGNDFLFFNITDMTEDEYNDISRSINSTEAMTFLADDNRTIISRRIYIDMLENTFFDAKLGMIYGVDNKIKLRVRCVDNTLTEADDVQEIEIKNIKKLEKPISINGAPVEEIKALVSNPSEITLDLTGDVGSYTIRVKAKIPTVQYLWLTAYPQLIKISEESQLELKKWLAENPQ